MPSPKRRCKMAIGVGWRTCSGALTTAPEPVEHGDECPWGARVVPSSARRRVPLRPAAHPRGGLVRAGAGAQALAIVLASPQLFGEAPGTVSGLRLANAHVRLEGLG